MEGMKVYTAINAVQTALSREGITKNRRNAQQGYNFRGIDDVYNALAPLLAANALCILPRVLSRECTERQTAKGGTLFYTVLDVEFDFVCALDGSRHVVRTVGEAMDSADKSSNKAMSAAYKYAVMQTFAIPTEGDNDADSTTHDPAPRSAPQINEAVVTTLRGAAIEGSASLKEAFEALKEEKHFKETWALHAAQLKKAAQAADARAKEQA